MNDILACPIDKHYPLELVELELAETPTPTPASASAAAAENEKEIVAGVLVCAKCNRYYPIIEGIPVMLPDELREKEKQRDLDFLEKWKSRLPDKVIKQGNPWHL